MVGRSGCPKSGRSSSWTRSRGRALVILEDVLEVSMEDTFDEVRAHFGGDIDEQVKEWLRSAEMHQYRRASL
jgi:hypothetical protein